MRWKIKDENNWNEDTKLEDVLSEETITLYYNPKLNNDIV